MVNRRLLIIGIALFVLTVLVRAPASWLIAVLPKLIDCQQPAGSVWRGACGQLRVGDTSLSDVHWQLHPLALLAGKLEVALQSADARAPGSATVALSLTGRRTLTDLRAELPVDTGFLPLFPSGWSGRLQLALSSVEFKSGRLAAIHGTATAHSLAQLQPPMSFGSFELHFADAPSPDGAISAQLRDVGGPLAVNGTLVVRNGSDYVLSGSAATRADASPELIKIVEFLGPADSQGRREFSVAGSR